MSYRRPATPSSVERLLRQEAGFGCAKCGHPYIEYHHIVPFSEEEHFRPEDMVALCGNCHPAMAKLGRDRQYEIKHRAHNIRTGTLHGALVYDKRDLVFKVGGNWYENTSTILQYNDTPIISCSLKDGQAKISLNLFDQTGSAILSVADNDVMFRVDDLWDFEYGHNHAIARYGPRKVAVRLDFRGDYAKIEGNIWLGSYLARLNPDEAIMPGDNLVSGNRFSGLRVGIRYSDRPDMEHGGAGIHYEEDRQG